MTKVALSLGVAILVCESWQNYSKSPGKLVEGWGMCRSLSNLFRGRHRPFEDGSSQELVLRVALGCEVLCW